MSTTPQTDIITTYNLNGYQAVAIETVEERRALEQIAAECHANGWKLWSLSASNILHEYTIRETDESIDFVSQPVSLDELNYSDAFSMLSDALADTVLVVFDFHTQLRNQRQIRSLLESLPHFRSVPKMVVLVAPSWRGMPRELTSAIPVVQFALPTRQDLQTAAAAVIDGLNQSIKEANGSSDDEPIVLTDEEMVHVVDAAAGLTRSQAEDSMALAAFGRRTIEPQIVIQEKMRLVRQSGYLEYWPSTDMSSVGGLDAYKRYLNDEVKRSLHDDALRVRGILLIGVPGNGKSLVCKATGQHISWPVLRMDIASLKAKFVGESEENMREALRLAEAIAPCVLWIDEIEKGISGYSTSNESDGGTTMGMVGTMLTWLQEHQHPIITLATCNDFQKLPPELTRAGRFDERFFVDLPTMAEREQIARIHLERLGCQGDVTAEQIAEMSEQFTGAEIEQLVKSAARQTDRKLTFEITHLCASAIKPLAQVQESEITALREFAQGTLRPAGDEQPAKRKRRTPKTSRN